MFLLSSLKSFLFDEIIQCTNCGMEVVTKNKLYKKITKPTQSTEVCDQVDFTKPTQSTEVCDQVDFTKPTQSTEVCDQVDFTNPFFLFSRT